MQLTASLSTSVCDVLRDSGAVRSAEQGQVHIISVAAIREEVGERWTRHQDLVEDFVIRAFRRNGREDDFIARVNEADFILIQPGRTSGAALSRASQLMRETLSYFLGTVKAENIRIAVVDRLQGDGVEATAVSADQMNRAAAERVDLRAACDGSPPWERFGVISAIRKVAMIERPDAATLKAMFYLQPVWNLRGSAVPSFLISAVVLQECARGELLPPEPSDLTPRCHLELALRSLAFAEEIWDRSPGTPIALHAPVAFATVSHSSCRMRLISQLKRLKDKGADRLLLIELTEVPEALPRLTSSALVVQLRPFVRGVLVRSERPEDIPLWRGSGICGVIWPSPPSDHAQLTRFASAARAGQLAAGFYAVSSHSRFVQAWAAGLTHVAGDLISRIYGDAAVPRRFTMEDLYRR
jgi:hypothetical protein